MNRPFAKLAMASVAAAGMSMMAISDAEAAKIKFSHTFASGGVFSGTVDGNIGSDGFTVTNLSNLMASFDGAPSVQFTEVASTPSPIFSLGTITSVNNDPTQPRVNLRFSNTTGFSNFGVNSINPPAGGQTAFVGTFALGTPPLFVQDLGEFGTWNAQVVPTPALLPGLLALAGGVVKKQRAKEREEA